MKKVVINICIIISILIIYILQANFFSWFNIAGVMPNLFIILILFIGLFANYKNAIIYGIITGGIIDLLLNESVGITIVAAVVIAILAGIFDKNFSKDNRMIIMMMVLVSTIIFEVIIYLLNYIIIGINIEILSFLKILAIEVGFNLLITIIIYPLIQNAGYYIENEYKGNKILTRYF